MSAMFLTWAKRFSSSPRQRLTLGIIIPNRQLVLTFAIRSYLSIRGKAWTVVLKPLKCLGARWLTLTNMHVARSRLSTPWLSSVIRCETQLLLLSRPMWCE